MNPQISIAAAAVCAFVAFWCALIFGISCLSGWRRLAREYPVDRLVSQEVVVTRFGYAQLRWACNYNGCVKISVSEQGLGVSIPWLFRMGHPPMFFPWREISVERNADWFGVERVTLRFAHEPNVPFRISRRLADKIAAAAGSDWPEYRRN